MHLACAWHAYGMRMACIGMRRHPHSMHTEQCCKLTCTSCIIWRSRLSSSLGYRRVNRGMPRLSKAFTKELWKGSTGQSRVPASGRYPCCMLVFHCDKACALSLRWSMFFVPGSCASSWIISRLSPRFRAKCVLRGLYARQQRVRQENGWYRFRWLQYTPSWINWSFAGVCCCSFRSTCGCFDASTVTCF